MCTKEKILITDDSALNRQLLADILGDRYEYLYAGDGVEALELLNSRFDIDLLLLDINMPRLDGFGVLETLRRRGAELPVVVISVGGEEVERISLTAMPDAPMRIEGRNGYTLSVSPSFNDLPGAKGMGVYVSHSDCPTQECVRTGVIRRAGQSIVCLPAQVVVYLEGTPAAGQPDVIVG